MTLLLLRGTSLAGRACLFPQDLPERPVALILGFAHESRHDVQRWKRALDRFGLPWLSLPSTVEDVPARALVGVAEAMKAHVPEEAWDTIVQVHHGAGALREAMGWRHDPHAKVLVTDRSGHVLAMHGDGEFSPEALEVVRYALTHGAEHPTLEA